MPLGSSPFGGSPFGYGALAQAGVPPTGLLTTSNGTTPTGRLLDPSTGDYVFDVTGTLVGMATVPQLVTLAAKTQLGSSTLATLGRDFTKLDTFTSDFTNRVTTAVTLMFNDLVQRQLITILSITVDRLGLNAFFADVRWRDLTTQIEDTTRVTT